VVADNCSPDATRAVVASYADPRIRYFRHEPGIKPNDNFNFYLQQANGAYFLLLHDDDKIDPDFVDTCLRAIGYDMHVGIIQSGTRNINPVGTVIGEGRNLTAGMSAADFILGWFAGKTPLYVCSTLYNLEGLEQVCGYNLILGYMSLMRFEKMDKAVWPSSWEMRTCSSC